MGGGGEIVSPSCADSASLFRLDDFFKFFVVLPNLSFHRCSMEFLSHHYYNHLLLLLLLCCRHDMALASKFSDTDTDTRLRAKSLRTPVISTPVISATPTPVISATL